MAARGLGKGLDALIPSGINEKKTHSESNSVQKKIDKKVRVKQWLILPK